MEAVSHPLDDSRASGLVCLDFKRFLLFKAQSPDIVSQAYSGIELHTFHRVQRQTAAMLFQSVVEERFPLLLSVLRSPGACSESESFCAVWMKQRWRCH